MEETVSEAKMTSRSNLKFYHYVGDFFNILKAFIGTNYQAVPFAFKNSGLLFGLLGVFGIAAMTDHCCQLMVRCKYYVIDQVLEEETFKGELSENELVALREKLAKTLGYGDIGKKVFGMWCYHLIQVAVWFTQFTTCMAYFIFIGNTVYVMFPIVQVTTNVTNTSHSHYRSDFNSLSGYGIPMLNIHFTSKVKDNEIGRLKHPNIDTTANPFTKKFIETDFQHRKDLQDYIFAEPSDMQFNNSSTTVTASPIYSSVIPINITTTALSNTSTSPTKRTTLPTIPPSPAPLWTTSAPDLKLVVLFPLPFFLVTSLIKKIRLIAPFSTIATLFLGVGAVSVFAFLVHGFSIVAGGFHWVKFATLPLFIGQLISAYEGIGCIIPIESSMEGNQWIFPKFLRAAVYTVFAILCSFGTVGYLRFGENVQQIIVLNMTQHTPLSMFVDITLVLSVLFTYPLQCFPTIEITETYFFSFLACLKPKRRHDERFEYDEIDSGHNSIQSEDGAIPVDQRGLLESVSSLDASLSKASVNTVKNEIPNWQRNILRIVLTLVILALSILCRNYYAYLAAFTGAVGCSLLAYIIPCAVHLKVKWANLSDENKVKDILIIGFSIFVSILTLIAIVQKIINGDTI